MVRSRIRQIVHPNTRNRYSVENVHPAEPYILPVPQKHAITVVQVTVYGGSVTTVAKKSNMAASDLDTIERYDL